MPIRWIFARMCSMAYRSCPEQELFTDLLQTGRSGTMLSWISTSSADQRVQDGSRGKKQNAALLTEANIVDDRADVTEMVGDATRKAKQRQTTGCRTPPHRRETVPPRRVALLRTCSWQPQHPRKTPDSHRPGPSRSAGQGTSKGSRDGNHDVYNYHTGFRVQKRSSAAASPSRS